MFFKRTDNLTSHLTSYDFLKFITVIFMLIDHTGAFFLTDELWLRVFGRLGFPAWFFLAGYSNSKSVSRDIWIGAAILIATTIIFGMNVFSLNALVSFIAIRICMTHFYEKYFASWELLIYVTAFMLLIALPTNYIFEYGTLAFLFAMMGFATRHKDKISIGQKGRILFFAVVIFSASYLQKLTFSFDILQWGVCLSLFIIASFVFFHFKSVEYPVITQKTPKALRAFIQFGGRYSMEIYVIHLFLIKAYLFFFMNDGRFEFMTPKFDF